MALACTACASPRTIPAVLPGDSVFDLLASAQVTRLPATNLPLGVLEAAEEPFVLEATAIEPHEWTAEGPAPADLRAFLGHAPVRLWSHRPFLSRWGRSEVTVLLRGRPHRRWDPHAESFPGVDVWWDEETGSLHALSIDPPEGVSLAVVVDPEVEFAPFEVVLTAGSRGTGLRPSSLVHTVTVGEVTRRALILPAPGCLTIPLGVLGCDELWVAVAVVDRAYRPTRGGLARAHGVSDGVVFAVEVSTRGRWTRIWESHLEGPSRAWGDPVKLDVRAYKGKRVTLRLVTEPGPAHNADFDYAVWGDLRFYGEASPPACPHIVLMDLDTLRRDRLGCYGNPRALSPGIDRWAGGSTVYEDCLAAAPWTLPSTVSMFTGLAVHQHRVDQFPEAMTEGMVPLPLALRRAGYETAGFAEGGYVAAGFGFGIGFDLYDCGRFKGPRWDEALRWLRRRRSARPVFLFLHTYLTHAPYPFDPRFEDPSRPYRTILRGAPVDYPTVIEPISRGELRLDDEDLRYVRDMYDAQVQLLDEYVTAFLDSLDEALRFEPCAVFLTSDHGEELMEHGLLGHGQSLFHELLAVPLIVRFPGQSSGVRDPRPVSGIDLVPTILDLAGLPQGDLPGRSLRGPARPAVRLASQSESVHAFVVGDLKLIRGRVYSPRGMSAPVQLYDLRRDPLERTDLAADLPETVAELEGALASFLREHTHVGTAPQIHAPGAWAVRRLEALGYVWHDQPRGAPHPLGHGVGR